MSKKLKFTRIISGSYTYGDWVIAKTIGEDRSPGYTWSVFNCMFRDGNSYEEFFGSLKAAKIFVEKKEREL